jgi:hypothetical protein
MRREIRVRSLACVRFWLAKTLLRSKPLLLMIGGRSGTGASSPLDTHYLSTMVADGLSIMNADFSSTSFRLAHASIGSRNFLGNWIVSPAQGKTGDNCLLPTKVGLLGRETRPGTRKVLLTCRCRCGNRVDQR